MVDQELLDILVCPKCKTDVKYLAEEEIIACQNPECGLRYPVRDGIPIMLIDEAEDPKAADEAGSDGDS